MPIDTLETAVKIMREYLRSHNDKAGRAVCACATCTAARAFLAKVGA